MTVQRRFRIKYHTEPPTDKTIREWYMNSSRVAACALRNEQAVRAYGPGRPVFESRQGRHIFLSCRNTKTVTGTQPSSCSMFIVVISSGYSGPGVNLIAHLHLLQRLTKSGTIIVLLLYNFKWRAGRTLSFNFTVDTKNLLATFCQSRTFCRRTANEPRCSAEYTYFTNMLTPCCQQVSDLCRLSVFSCCVVTVVSGKEPTRAEF